MHNCRRRKCCCMNNDMTAYSRDILETKCDNVANYNIANVDSCQCGFEEEEDVFPANPMFAQSYVPWQTMDQTFKPCVGLRMGTIFPELVSPYRPCQSIDVNNFIEATNEIGEGCNR